MFKNVKMLVRDILPKRYQVPAKYWYGWMRSNLEPEMKLLGDLVRKGDRVVDVGGNRGIYAYQLWQSDVTVEVFEPNLNCFKVLTAWAAGKPNVHLHSVALSSQAGSTQLHIPVDSSGVEHDASASIEHSAFTQSRDQLVTLQTLDSYQFKNVSLIKIDVEGHEYSVINGAGETLTTSRPALLIEIEQRHISRPISEVFKKILDFGYQGYYMGANGLTALEHFDVVRDQSMESFGNPTLSLYINNFLFLHRARLADGEYAALISGQVYK